MNGIHTVDKVSMNGIKTIQCINENAQEKII